MRDVQGRNDAARTHDVALPLGSLAGADLPHTQIVAWTSDARRIAELAAAGAVEALPVFWIRLYGVLKDIADLIELTMDHFDPSCAFPLARLGPDASALHRAIEALAAVYTADELLYIEYRRHLECHPLQRYRSQRSKLRSSTRTLSAVAAGQALTIDGAAAVSSELLSNLASSEAQIGAEFARRAVAHLRELEAATQRLFR